MTGGTIGLVCARSGSVGLVNKNLLQLGCRREKLIERAIRIALAAGCDEVVVSTDYTPGEDFDLGGARWVWRPNALTGPLVSKWKVYKHAVETWEREWEREATTIVDVDVTRPLRTVETVRRVISKLDECPAVMAVARADKHPAFDIVTDTPRGARPYDDLRDYVARQQLPAAYLHAGAYGFTREALLHRSLGLYDGPVEMVLADRVESFDIDDALDWQVVQALHRRGVQAAYPPGVPSWWHNGEPEEYKGPPADARPR